MKNQRNLRNNDHPLLRRLERQIQRANLLKQPIRNSHIKISLASEDPLSEFKDSDFAIIKEPVEKEIIKTRVPTNNGYFTRLGFLSNRRDRR